MTITAPIREVMTESANLRSKLAEAQKELFEANGRHGDEFIVSSEAHLNLFHQILNNNEVGFMTASHEGRNNYEPIFNDIVALKEKLNAVIDDMRSG